MKENTKVIGGGDFSQWRSQLMEKIRAVRPAIRHRRPCQGGKVLPAQVPSAFQGQHAAAADNRG